MASVDANSILSSFASNYVRSVVGNEVKRKEVLECLERDEPHVDTAFAAIVIIDVSGYSRITSQLAEHGRVSSELVTLALCDYFNQIIGVIESHGGDVVKFLGDAVLAVFRNTPPETKPQDTAVTDSSSTLSDTLPDFSTITSNVDKSCKNVSAFLFETKEKRLSRDATYTSVRKKIFPEGFMMSRESKQISESSTIQNRNSSISTLESQFHLVPSLHNVSERAFRCCLHIMNHHPSVSLKHSSIQRLLLQASNGSAGTAPMYPKPGAIALGSEDEAHMISGGLLMSGNADLQHHVVESHKSPSPSKSSKIELKLHIALTSGLVDFVILGNARKRLDFVVHGECFKDLGELLESAKPGECAVQYNTWNQVFPTFTLSADGTAISSNPFFESASHAPTSHSNWKHAARYGRHGIVLDAPLASDIYRIISPSQLQRKDTSKTKTSVDEDPGAVMGKGKGGPILKKGPNGEFVRRFVNESIAFQVRSRISEAGSDGAKGVVTDIRNQFRYISIIFVRLLKDFDAHLGQKALRAFLLSLEENQGIFQQFSMDDKGQSMLACFGLPPHTQQNTSEKAIRAALHFSRSFSLCKTYVSVTSGEILFAKLGNDIRSEASLLGDVVNIAARLLSVASSDHPIICDSASAKAASNSSLAYLPIFHSLGKFDLKGSMRPVEAWGVEESISTKSTQLSRPRNHSDIGSGFLIPTGGPSLLNMVGYLPERQKMKELLEAWREDSSKRHVVAIEASSGMGKTGFVETFVRSFASTDLDCCLTKIQERDKLIPFAALRSVILHIIHNELSLSMSNLISAPAPLVSTAPAATTKRRSSSFINPVDQQPPGNKSFRSMSVNDHVEPLVSCQSSASIQIMSSPSESTFFPDRASVQRSEADFFASITHPGSSVPQYDLDGQRTLEAIASLMIKVGEDPRMAPLIGSMVPMLRSVDTEDTKNITGRARINVLKTTLGRLISKWIEMRDIVLVFDDVQWMDEISMDIIKAVIKGAGKHFLVLSTRPQNILDSLGFDQNNSLSIKTANITLNGLALEDVNEFLISRFSSLGVESVDQELVKVMHSKCEGSPLNLQMMVQYLKSDECLKVSENVLGLVPEKAPIIQSLLERGLSQTIMSQFDKLHGGLRDLLERASIFGQHFDLNDVKNLSEESPNILSMRRLILERDTCEFVVCSEFDPTTTTLFSFRHAAIAATIYSTMSFSERSKLHRIAGENYEATISEKNREMLLPLLVYHYSLSDCHLKYIDFVEELSMYYMKRGFHAECRILIRELIEFVTANESSNLAPDNKRLASWYAALALSASTDFQLETVKTAAVTALLLIGRQFPLTEQEVPHYILKSLFRHLWLLMTKPPKRSITRAKKSNIHNEDITDMALFSLHYVFLGAGESIPDAYKLVTLLELLNEAIIIAGQEPAKWAVRAFQAAFAVRLVSMPISRYYYSSALLATTKCEEHEFLHAFPMFLALLIADNKYEEAVRMNEVFINIARQKAEVGMIQSSTNYAYLLRMHNSPQESLSLMLQQLDEAVVQDIYVSDNSVYNMMEIAIYARDMKKIRESLERTQELRQRLLNKSVAYKENRQAQIQVIVGELWISLFESKINDALEHVKELGSFVQSISAISHFFTAFTLGFFGVWVLITLIDTQDANVIAKKRLILSSHLEIPRKKLSAISRNHMPTQDFQTLFQAAHLLLKGKRGKAVKQTRKLLVSDFRPTQEKYNTRLVAFAEAAMYLMTGNHASKASAVRCFGTRNLSTYLAKWISESTPLKEIW